MASWSYIYGICYGRHFFNSFLHYDFFRSDVLGYWQDSISWKTPFHPFHVPGYALLIAFMRGITFNAFPPVGLMMGINLIALLASAFLIYRILQESGSSDGVAAIGVFLFSLYPFVGLTYTVTPLADMPAMCLFLVGFNLLQRSFRMPAALFLGLSLVTHKAMWVFVGLLVIFDFMQRKEYVSKRNFFFVGLMLLPIGTLFVSVSVNGVNSLCGIFKVQGCQ